MTRQNTARQIGRNDARYTKCDSCSDTWFEESTGDITHEQPHRADVNSEAGICPSCVSILRKRGFSDERIFGVPKPDSAGVASVAGETDRAGGKVGSRTDRTASFQPVQFRPAAQINFEKAA